LPGLLSLNFVLKRENNATVVLEGFALVLGSAGSNKNDGLSYPWLQAETLKSYLSV
jgi:hypothetical protein